MLDVLCKLKKQPVITVCTVFTILSSLTWLSSGIRVAWFIMWIVVPLILAEDKAFACLAYMSLYMRIAIDFKLFSIITCLSFLIILIKQIIYLNKNKSINKYFKIIIYYLFLTIIPLFYSIFLVKNVSIEFIYYFNMLNLLFLVYLLKNKINLNLILLYSYGVIVSSILSIVLYLGGLSWFPFDAGNRFCAFMQLCNTLGVVCIVCINLLYMMMLNKKISQKQAFSIIAVLSLIGCLTLSKNFLIMFVITLAIIFTHQFSHSKNKGKIARYTLIALVALSPILLCYGTVMFDRFFGDKSYGNIIDTISTGRLDKWLIYLKPWYKNWSSVIFGLGLCYNYNTPYSSHSLYIGYLSRMGLVGLIAIIGFVIFIIKQSSSKLRFRYCTLIIIAIICLAEDLSHNTFNFVPFAMSLVPIMNGSKQ